MNKKLLIGLSLFTLSVGAQEQATQADDTSMEALFPHAAKIQQTFRETEKQIAQSDADMEKLMKDWQQSVAALSLAIKKLDNFDCGTIPFQIEYVEKYIVTNQQRVKQLTNLVRCQGADKAQCLSKVGDVNTEIGQLGAVVSKQKQLLAELGLKHNECTKGN